MNGRDIDRNRGVDLVVTKIGYIVDESINDYGGHPDRGGSGNHTAYASFDSGNSCNRSLDLHPNQFVAFTLSEYPKIVDPTTQSVLEERLRSINISALTTVVKAKQALADINAYLGWIRSWLAGRPISAYVDMSGLAAPTIAYWESKKVEIIAKINMLSPSVSTTAIPKLPVPNPFETMVTEFNKALTLPVATTAPAKVAATPAPRFKFDDFKLKSAPAPAKVTTLPVIVVQPKPKESPCSTSAFVKSTLKGCAQGMDMLCLIPKQPPNPIMTARPQFNKILKQDDHLGAIRTGACIGGMTMGFLNQWNACQESIAKEKAAQKKTELEKLNALNFIRPGYR